MEGKRRQGRPPISSSDDIHMWIGMTVTEAGRASSDREKWKGELIAAAQHALNE